MTKGTPRASRWARLTVLLGSGLATLAVAIPQWATGRQARYVDDGVIAFRLLDGQGYSLAFHGPPGPTAAYSPLMPLLLAGVHLVLGDQATAVAAVVVLQGLIHVGAALLTYAIARAWLPVRTSSLCGLLVGIHPRLIMLTLGKGHLDERYGLAVLLMLLALWALLRVWNAPAASGVDFAVLGVAFGLAALSDATIAVVALVVFIVLLVPSSRRRWGWRGPLTFAGTAALIVAPWVARNAIVFRTLVPMRSSGGLLLWVGNNPEATGTWEDQEITDDPERKPSLRGSLLLGGHASTFNFRAQGTLPEDVRKELRVVDEVQRDRLLLRAAVDWIRQHPGQFVKLSLRRALYLIAGPPGTGRFQRPILAATFLAAWAAALLRFFPGQAWIAVFLSVWWLAFTITHCGYLDYRVVMEPFVILSCAAGAQGLYRKYGVP